MHCAVAFGNPTAARAVHANSMDLVEIGHRAIPLGDIANVCDGCDIAIHRIDRLEADELRPPGIGTHQAVLEVDGVVVTENLVLGAADGCEHWWYRGPQCTLLVFIDDATQRPAESGHAVAAQRSPLVDAKDAVLVAVEGDWLAPRLQIGAGGM